MKWNVDGLKYLYKEIEEARDEKMEEAEREAKEGNYSFASMSKTEAYGLTTALNWIVKVDREIKDYRMIEQIDKDGEKQAKKCEKCLTKGKIQ